MTKYVLQKGVCLLVNSFLLALAMPARSSSAKPLLRSHPGLVEYGTLDLETGRWKSIWKRPLPSGSVVSGACRLKSLIRLDCRIEVGDSDAKPRMPWVQEPGTHTWDRRLELLLKSGALVEDYGEQLGWSRGPGDGFFGLLGDSTLAATPDTGCGMIDYGWRNLALSPDRRLLFVGESTTLMDQCIYYCITASRIVPRGILPIRNGGTKEDRPEGQLLGCSPKALLVGAWGAFVIYSRSGSRLSNPSRLKIPHAPILATSSADESDRFYVLYGPAFQKGWTLPDGNTAKEDNPSSFRALSRQGDQWRQQSVPLTLDKITKPLLLTSESSAAIVEASGLVHLLKRLGGIWAVSKEVQIPAGKYFDLEARTLLG